MAAATLAERTVEGLLDRHEERRRGGVPTVSVLAGDPDALAAALGGWARRRGRPLVLVERGPWSLPLLATAWLRAVAAACDLREQAARWLVRRLPEGRKIPPESLLAKTPIERELFLDGALPGTASPDEQALCRALLREPSTLAAFPFPATRLLAALGRLLPVEWQPVLALEVGDGMPGPGADSPCAIPARLLVELAVAGPGLALALVADAAALGDYLDAMPDSRAKALLREAVIWIRDDRPEHRPDPPIPRRIDGPEGADDARSAAERFLFDCLQTSPATAGLFRLNVAVAMPWGTHQEVEIDLLAESLGLAVEVDGYHHFQDVDSYRRDRRKDLELQKHGYLVLRVLAEDVVSRLEQVLEMIHSAVAFRRDSQGGPHE
jgi:hypothetical protein